MNGWTISVSTRIALFVVTVPALLLTPRPHAERPPSQSRQPTAVNVGEGNAPPDAPVALPVSLSAADAVHVGAINIRLGFPKALLAFVKIELSGLASAAGAEVRAEVQKGPNDDYSILDATISTGSKAESRRALPVGHVAQIVFHVDKSAKPSTWIPLTHEASASTTDDPPLPIAPVAAYRARIGVSIPPVTGCFFYMH